MIDPKQYQELQRHIDTLRLGLLYPDVVAQFARLCPGTTDPLDLAVWPHVQSAVASCLGDAPTTGLVKVPARLLPSGFPIGYHGNDIAYISSAAHTLIVGATGAGKTSMLQLLLLGAYQQRLKLIIPDGKRDSRFWLGIDRSFLVINEKTPINPIAQPPWCPSVAAHITLTSEWLARQFYSGQIQGACWRIALTDAFEKVPNPSLQDVARIVALHQSKSKTFAWQDGFLGVQERLHRIELRYPVAFNTRDGVPIMDLVTSHVYLDTMSIDGVGEYLTSLVINHVHEYQKHTNNRQITHLAAIDESTGLTSKAHAQTHITGTSAFMLLSTKNREHGTRLVFAVHDLAATDSTILQCVSTIALLPGVTDETALRRLGLNQQQIASARHLQRGQALLLYPGQLAWPVLITFPPLPDGLKERKPPTPPDRLITTRDAQQPPAEPSAAPKHDPNPPGPPMVVALNAAEEAILRYVATRTISTVSEAYEATQLHYARGDQAKTKLLQLGLLIATPITVHDRRGGRALGLQASPKGYERVGITPTRRSRGGGAQAEFLIQRLHEHLPGSNIEVSLDGKAPDLLLRIDSVQHQNFLIALNEHGQSINGEPPTIPHNTLIAIEVECATPADAASIKNNLTKDRAAGLTTIIFAVMPKEVGRTIQHLNNENAGGIIVINALQLLNALRGDRS